MSLATVRLEDILDTLIDYRGKTPTKTTSGVRLITAKVIKGGFIDDSSFEYIAEDEYDAWMRRGLPRPGDLLVTTEAPLGEVARVPNERIALAQRVILLRADRAKMDQRYLFHAFRSPFVQAELQKRATGTTVLGIKQSELRQIQVPAPNLDTQRRIADVLSAYDDLIENNMRRIKILEELARSLYREWFVEFRFPGHERSAFVRRAVGRVPHGWDVQPLAERLVVHRGRSYKSTELADAGGLPFVNLKCFVRDGGFRRDGIKRFVGEAKANQHVRAGDIVMAVTDMTQERRIVARAARVPRMSEPVAAFSMDVVKLEPRDPRDKPFLYAMLRHSSFSDEVKKHANGANVLHLSPDRIESYVGVFPPTRLMRRFGDMVAPLADEQDVLALKNDALLETRGLLLPRLFAGEIELEP